MLRALVTADASDRQVVRISIWGARITRKLITLTKGLRGGPACRNPRREGKEAPCSGGRRVLASLPQAVRGFQGIGAAGG
jgi:hypothetical protein